MQIFLTENDKPLLQDDEGFFYVLHKTTAQKRYWRCRLCRHSLCRCSLHTSATSLQVIKTINSHTHEISPSDCRYVSISNSIKERAETTTEATTGILDRVIAEEDAITSTDVRIPTLKRRIQAIRSRSQNGLINVNNLSELIVAEGFLKIELFDGIRENIIKYDSGPESGTDRLIILSKDRNLEYLGETSEIFCDGTFKVAPPLFNQFYSIMGLFMIVFNH